MFMSLTHDGSILNPATRSTTPNARSRPKSYIAEVAAERSDGAEENRVVREGDGRGAWRL